MPGFPLYLSGWRGHPISNQIKTLLPTCRPESFKKVGGMGRAGDPWGRAQPGLGG